MKACVTGLAGHSIFAFSVDIPISIIQREVLLLRLCHDSGLRVCWPTSFDFACLIYLPGQNDYLLNSEE